MLPRVLLPALALATLACDPPPPVSVEPAAVEPVAVVPRPIAVVTQDGSELSPETERAILDAVGTLQNGVPEPLPADAVAAAQDPTPLLGRWQITETRGSINGEKSEPSQPLMPTAWVFTKDGRMQVDGGMQISATYTFSGKRLVVAGMGPALDYDVVRLTGTDLEVVSRITAGDSLVIENTTVLKKVP